LWYAMGDSLGGWRSRWPEMHKEAVPVSAQPRMQFSKDPARVGQIKDHMSNGRLLERTEVFQVPTIERERLLSHNSVQERIPSIESVFKFI
ncbi:MAG: hypothetical protein K2Q15_16360, partial [Burkholderiales bacterium]|nr:hypothetical protein [Burkholderiales bacterium]